MLSTLPHSRVQRLMVKVKVKPFFISFCIENVTVTDNPESRMNEHWINKVLVCKDIPSKRN